MGITACSGKSPQLSWKAKRYITHLIPDYSEAINCNKLFCPASAAVTAHKRFVIIRLFKECITQINFTSPTFNVLLSHMFSTMATHTEESNVVLSAHLPRCASTRSHSRRSIICLLCQLRSPVIHHLSI